MKKRILAVLLMVVILAALLAGLSVTAAAENDISGDTISGYVIPYTLKAGDTVLKVCNTLGIDFHKNQALITKINSIADYSKLPVGKVVWLPATSVGSASDYYTLKTHKVVSGDNVNTLLTKYSIAATDAMLNKVNNNLASPVVGSTITFPVYKGSATAKMADTTIGAIGTGIATAAATATGISTTTGVTVPTSGSVAYYLLAYQMKAGDTVGAVCTANGINFAQHSALISRINGITNYNRIPVGRVVMLPTATATGATYSVVAHQIQVGETANAICASYGINLATNLTLIKGLNNTNNLNYIQAGGILYVPVGGGISPTPGPGPTPGPTPTPSGDTYKLSKDDCDNGSFVLKVDGVEVTSAAAGKTVSIVCTGKGGYVQKTVVAHLTGDTTKVVKVTNNTFTMPEFNVTVSVTFGKATNYSLTCKAPVYGTGSYELTVDNKIVTSQTYGGAVVTVKPKPAANYMLDTIKVTYKGSDGKDKEVAVTDNKFTMPNADATVEVTFKPSAGYEYPLVSAGTPLNGKFEIKNSNDIVISKAKSGQEVRIYTTADKDYKVDYIKYSYYVWNDDTNTKELRTGHTVQGRFTMPTFDDEIGVGDRKVTIEVAFIKSKVYSITIKADTAKTDNSVTARINEIGGSPVTQAEEGRNIIIVPKYSKNGYELQSVTWTNESTHVTTTISASDLATKNPHFVMPAANVTIVPTYIAAVDHTITPKPDPSWAGTVTFTVNASAATKAKQGETVNMTITPVNTDVKLKSVKVVYTYAGKDVEVPVSGNNFTMPAYAVDVKAEFELATFPINTTANANVNKVEYYVNSQLATRATPGDNVLIKATMNSGYAVKKIEVTYVDSKGKTQEVPVIDNVFVMPDNVATVTITEETTDGSFEINVIDTSNGTAKVVDKNKPSITMTRANKDYELQVVCEPSTYYETAKVEYRKEGASTWTTLSSPYQFKMPDGNIEVKVTFKAKIFKLSSVSIDSSIGELIITDSGNKAITEAPYGDTVKIVATAKDGYKLVSVGAKNKDTGVLYVTGNSFQMPAFDVEVYAEFVAMKKNLELTANDAENGTYTLQVGGADVTKADEGATVTVAGAPNSGYSIGTITVVTSSGKTVSVTGYSFTMPDEAVTVTVTFKEG